ncbi:hypothetical protein P7K49_012761, partial [Saguinus oedipus]
RGRRLNRRPEGSAWLRTPGGRRPRAPDPPPGAPPAPPRPAAWVGCPAGHARRFATRRVTRPLP